MHLDHHWLTLKSTLFRNLKLFCLYEEITSLCLRTVFLRPAADTSFCVYISIGAVKYITFLFEKIIPKTVKRSYIGNYFVSFQPSFIYFSFPLPCLFHSLFCFCLNSSTFFQATSLQQWGLCLTSLVQLTKKIILERKL